MRSLQPLDGHDLRVLACPACGRTPSQASFGFKAVREGLVVGVLAAAPASELGGFYPRDAVVITQAWVRSDDVRELIGTQLVQRTAAVLAGRRVRCLVAGGTRGVPDCAHLPADFLERLGFVEFVPGSQWRLDLRSTVKVPDAVAALAAGLAGLVRPGRPAPAGRTASAGPAHRETAG